MKKINLYKIVSFSYKLRIFLAYVLPPLSLKSGSVLAPGVPGSTPCLVNYFFFFLGKFYSHLEIWVIANQILDFSKLTNLVPKTDLVHKIVEKK